jgi:hypothetical protein
MSRVRVTEAESRQNTFIGTPAPGLASITARVPMLATHFNVPTLARRRNDDSTFKMLSLQAETFLHRLETPPTVLGAKMCGNRYGTIEQNQHKDH